MIEMADQSPPTVGKVAVVPGATSGIGRATAPLAPGTLLAEGHPDDPPTTATDPTLRNRLWDLLDALTSPV
jgi:hypothetical protein